MAFEGENEEVETVGLEEVWRWFVLLFFNVFSTWLPVGSLAVNSQLQRAGSSSLSMELWPVHHQGSPWGCLLFRLLNNHLLFPEHVVVPSCCVRDLCWVLWAEMWSLLSEGWLCRETGVAGVRTGVAGVPCDGRWAAVGLRGKDLPILGRRGVCV